MITTPSRDIFEWADGRLEARETRPPASIPVGGLWREAIFASPPLAVGPAGFELVDPPVSSTIDWLLVESSLIRDVRHWKQAT